MQTRLLASLAGGCFGVLVSSRINEALGLNPTVAVVGCALMGVALGHAASMFWDVFTESPKEKDSNT